MGWEGEGVGKGRVKGLWEGRVKGFGEDGVKKLQNGILDPMELVVIIIY